MVLDSYLNKQIYRVHQFVTIIGLKPLNEFHHSIFCAIKGNFNIEEGHQSLVFILSSMYQAPYK